MAMCEAGTSMDIDPEVAKTLFEEGAVLIIAGVPVGTEFGIDLCAYTVGDRFRGVKMIPPGPHYVYCSSKGPYGDSAPRVGFLHFFKPYEILVREWDDGTEELRERRTADPDLEKRRIRENLKDLDRFLAAYAYRDLERWRRLTGAITEEGVKRCMPECGIVRTNVELMSCPDSERPRGGRVHDIKLSLRSLRDEDELLPNLKPIPGSAPRFIALPDRIPMDATPAEISQCHLDRINAIEDIMGKFLKPVDLIEEIQIAFVLFFVGYSLEALTHWRKLLNFLANSETAVGKFKLFYMKYLEVLQYQLPHIPEEFMEQSDNNTVYKDVRKLILNCTVNGLSVNAEKLIKSLKRSMQWDFVGLLDEDPEDMPVIVDTQ